VVAFGVVAWRGLVQEPVLAACFGVFTLGALGAWLRWRLRATRQLTITRTEITYGRPGHIIDSISRSVGPLEFRRILVMQSGWSWWLGPPRQTGVSSIPMLGFDLREVQEACVSRGWDFTP
jgi:hypothetical protein